MPEREARARAVYDHDNEEPRPSGRRRRQVADWGVGEELFDGMPGRRFERRPHQDIPRGDAADGRRTIKIETEDGALPPERATPSDEEFASRDEALRAREAHDELWGGDEPFADRAADVESEPDAPVEYDGVTGRFADEAYDDGAGEAHGFDGADEHGFEHADEYGFERADGYGFERGGEDAGDDGIVRGTQAGRRTVKIAGRPAEFYGPPARARHRPPPSFHERLGPRPERIAGWAFALGMLLILIAVLTANI
jgi:hypothetical protein